MVCASSVRYWPGSPAPSKPAYLNTDDARAATKSTALPGVRSAQPPKLRKSGKPRTLRLAPCETSICSCALPVDSTTR
ncbi:hypothetical protein D3C72_948180 [compost metagenome]